MPLEREGLHPTATGNPLFAEDAAHSRQGWRSPAGRDASSPAGPYFRSTFSMLMPDLRRASVALRRSENANPTIPRPTNISMVEV